ncbi:hypothetical protein E9S_08884 [Moraxella catarrhalis BC7]|nr:hypothetical protein E9S_08884 [Moraxella catarrhalis BC7]
MKDNKNIKRSIDQFGLSKYVANYDLAWGLLWCLEWLL